MSDIDNLDDLDNEEIPGEDDIDNLYDKLEREFRADLKRRTHTLVLHNDDFNSFDDIINNLKSVLNMGQLQAEQIAYIIHFKGSYKILKSSKEAIDTITWIMQTAGITATTEKI